MSAAKEVSSSLLLGGLRQVAQRTQSNLFFFSFTRSGSFFFVCLFFQRLSGLKGRSDSWSR